MPLAITRYGTNLYSLNALGAAWLDGAVTRATFRGPPLVVVQRLIDNPATVVGITAVAAFADYWGVPLVGFETTYILISWSTEPLRWAGVAASPLFTTGGVRPFAYPTSSISTTGLAFTGPWLALEDLDNASTIAAWSHLGQMIFTRSAAYHRYQLGMQGVSAFTPSSTGSLNAPPLYAAGAGGDVAGDLNRLTRKWQGEMLATVSQVETLAAAAALRPGLARLCNPALLPELVLQSPP